MSYEDKTLECVDCGSNFTFSASEQEFFANKGFTNEPKRCPDCRQSRKEQRRAQGYDGGDAVPHRRDLGIAGAVPAFVR